MLTEHYINNCSLILLFSNYEVKVLSYITSYVASLFCSAKPLLKNCPQALKKVLFISCKLNFTTTQYGKFSFYAKCFLYSIIFK